MKKFRVTMILFLVACCVWGVTLYGKDSYAHVQELKGSLVWQQQQNEVLAKKVSALRHRVAGLQEDSRAVEVAARNELGVARSDELIVFFEKKAENEQ